MTNLNLTSTILTKISGTFQSSKTKCWEMGRPRDGEYTGTMKNLDIFLKYNGATFDRGERNAQLDNKTESVSGIAIIPYMYTYSIQLYSVYTILPFLAKLYSSCMSVSTASYVLYKIYTLFI